MEHSVALTPVAVATQVAPLHVYSGFPGLGGAVVVPGALVVRGEVTVVRREMVVVVLGSGLAVVVVGAVVVGIG